MKWWDKLYCKLINLPLHFMVKSESIPADPIAELGIELNKKILYILPYTSKVDLLVLRAWSKELRLNDPFEDININGTYLPSFVFIDKTNQLINVSSENIETLRIFKKYIALHRQYKDLDIQIIPVAILFGRAPDKEGRRKLNLLSLNGFQKFIMLLRSGRRDTFVRFSKAASFRHISDNLQATNVNARKLMRVARIHFSRQRLAAVGPQLPNRSRMFKKLLSSPTVKNAIEDEAKNKKIPIKQAEKNALGMLNEIAANFNYHALRLTDRVLSWAWNKLYRGLKVTNAEIVRSYAQEGYEIVYAPCHRSHMDYLLLSYILYKQGLVPPHITAGINLNFWPAGPIFRRLGAFFIRRSFKGNKLYTAVFREYLSELFSRGYSVEYFVEGGRSRTGRLLNPKTGTLTITLQALLRGDTQPIIIVPVYIGYEHVMEVGTYARELRGANKQKENIWLALKAFFKLKNLGYGYVNFGQPISLNNFLNNHVENWRDAINPNKVQRPLWLNNTVNHLAINLMENINAAAVVNPMNLCSCIILSAKQYALTKEMVIEQLHFYLQLLSHVPSSDKIVLPEETPEELLERVLEMDDFTVDSDEVGEIISVTRQNAALLTYYRNNIQHLIILPALIVRFIINKQHINREHIIKRITLIYPLLKEELFIHIEEKILHKHLDNIISELIKQSLIQEQDNHLSLNSNHFIMLQIFAANADEILQRYLISLSLLQQKPEINRSDLEKESRIIAERLSLLHGINAPEFFDKTIFSTLVSTLKKNGYMYDDNTINIEKTSALYKIIKLLVTPDIRQTISSIYTQTKI